MEIKRIICSINEISLFVNEINEWFVCLINKWMFVNEINEC